MTRRGGGRSKRTAITAIISLVAGIVAPASAGAVELSFIVEGVRNAMGRVNVYLCPEEEFLGEECPFRASVAANEGETSVVFVDVPPGLYGVQAFHDENENTKMDRNFVGWPLEGFAFANNPEIFLRAPSFEASSIVIGEENLEVRMMMQYR
ncbi:MAG: DUF2141 domain-containing protein [Pseudomonadota bacterium]